MNTLAQSLESVLRRPTPAELVALQEALLVHTAPGAQRDSALALAARFYRYLSELESRLTAREYSELASWLDIAAVGLVAFQELIRGEVSGSGGLLVGLASEGAMILASRQYIKAWNVEAGPIHQDATWYLREALWRLSEEGQPQLAPETRLAVLRRTLPDALDQAPHSARAVVLGRIFQTLLLIRVSPLLAASSDGQ